MKKIKDKPETNEKLATKSILRSNEISAKKDLNAITANLEPWKADFLTDWLASGSVSTASLSFNMVERLFRLKSLDRDRYADRGKNVGANVQVNIAFGDGVVGYTRHDEKKNTVNNNKKTNFTEIATQVK